MQAAKRPVSLTPGLLTGRACHVARAQALEGGQLQLPPASCSFDASRSLRAQQRGPSAHASGSERSQRRTGGGGSAAGCVRAAAMARAGSEEVMVVRPTKADFSRPFAEFVGKVLKKHPDLPMFKVIPPEGWRPRRWGLGVRGGSVVYACAARALAVGGPGGDGDAGRATRRARPGRSGRAQSHDGNGSAALCARLHSGIHAVMRPMQQGWPAADVQRAAKSAARQCCGRRTWCDVVIVVAAVLTETAATIMRPRQHAL
jgi:hypothetical protein